MSQDAPRRRKREPAVRAICGAPKTGQREGLCQHEPGHGTDHHGVGRCKFHGGNLPSGKIAAGVQIAAHLGGKREGALTNAPVYGMPEDMAPADALLWCVAITAGEVRYLSAKVAGLTEDEVLGRSPLDDAGGEDGFMGMRAVQHREVQPHLWVRERRLAVDRLAKMSSMAITAGVSERLVALAEHQATELADLFRAVFDDIGLTPAQWALAEPVLERRLLLESESGSAV